EGAVGRAVAVAGSGAATADRDLALDGGVDGRQVGGDVARGAGGAGVAGDGRGAGVGRRGRRAGVAGVGRGGLGPRDARVARAGDRVLGEVGVAAGGAVG